MPAGDVPYHKVSCDELRIINASASFMKNASETGSVVSVARSCISAKVTPRQGEPQPQSESRGLCKRHPRAYASTESNRKTRLKRELTDHDPL